MTKYTVTTELKTTKIYHLTYELELDHEPTLDDLMGYTPIDEEFYDEHTHEQITDIDEV